MSIFSRLFSKRKDREFRRGFGEVALPRLHPYRFAHYGLREAVFESPSSFFDRMRSGEAEAWLQEIWRYTGARAAIEGNGRPVPADGLTLTWSERDGEPYPIVTLPTPERFTEAYFAAVVPPLAPDEAVRYFLLERSESATADHPTGLLCEWFADGRRTNHLWLLSAERTFFEEAIVSVLRDEARRRQVGVLPAGMPRWKPDEEPGMQAEERPAHFRPQHVLFAYHLVPKAASQFRMVTDKHARLIELWEEAGRLAAQAGDSLPLTPEGLGVQEVTVGDEPHLLVVLPEPVGAPEAYFVILSLDEDSPKIYTLERPCARRDLETIVGEIRPEGHAVCSWSEDASDEAFLDTVEHLQQGMSRPEPPYDLVGQLLLYRPVFKFIREVDSTIGAD